ncbi:RsmB/NOP family class I SAM-dependent RNA methyltransferase [Aestuariispira ectoiniformans]|uniref:RsmB/NOP family class I SAM-dependent RNA methyltransferase n=1 Tax=Aestuariispira ectoiniformans TaxID=2775080 RepID=UPI00223B67D6|nr:RsmB/NOP family class I SAM-dependent RNA methyltransferase [Aestuariispira ectoiniformans]
MKPGARIAAAIEILDLIDLPDAIPADKVLADWNRKNRFAGSKDRNAIAEMVYGVLRRRAQLDWWLQRCNGDLDNRARLLVWLQAINGVTLEDLTLSFDGSQYAPTPLSAREERVAVEMQGQQIDSGCQPVSAKGNFPDWMESRFVELYGAKVDKYLAAMTEEAPVDLRVNTLKGTRSDAMKALAEEGIETTSSRFSPVGLRLPKRMPLSGTKAFRDGLIEVQDEGSQLAALLADARAGHKVVDFCAGAGGKSLAMAATMKNTGRIVACDVSEARLKRAAQRLKRAGAFMVERRPLTSERDKWIKRRAARFGGGFDRVLVDAPCSGTGTWRRNPDQKWRLKGQDIEELTALQASILDSASRLVGAGGRLIYATCSILNEENDAQIDRFLAENPSFFLHPIKQIWQEIFPSPCPTDGDTLRLNPLDHGTDGFFVAVLERKL